jgi:hypothetical protein
VAIDLHEPAWLADLVDEELAAFDPAAALERIPAALREGRGTPLDTRARALALRSLRPPPGEPPPAGARAFFLSRHRGHVRLLLELGLLAGRPFEPGPRRAELAALLALLAGEVSQGLAVDLGHPRGGKGRVAERALAAAAVTLAESGWPPGDPREGLPLSLGELRIERLLLARLAVALHRRNRLDEPEVRRRLEQAGRDAALLVECLAAHALAAGRLDAHRRKAARHQVAHLRLTRELERRVREALRQPRGPAELARAAPQRLRPFLVEELLLAEALGPPTPAGRAFVEEHARHAGISADRLEALRAEATALAAGQRWQEGPPEWVPGEVQGLPEEWGDAADELVDKVTGIFQDNLDAIAQEVRQTGELGQLLAKAARGVPLAPAEKKRVKVQLIDLAKAVPALAIFAAPGGMLLLPLLAKLLPFNVLPSAWEERRSSTPPPRRRPGTS